MSYKTNAPNSYRRRSMRKQGMYFIPFLVGIIVATLIYVGWLFLQLEGETEIHDNFMINGYLIILLLVEIPIAVIVIYFAYRNKVVKMKPKSAYKIGNINDYLQAREQYQGGYYEYETIKSFEDIVKAHENGKKIVFTGIKYGTGLIWIGIVIVIIGLIIGIAHLFREVDIMLKMISFSISLSISGLLGATFFLTGFIYLKRRPRSFFVLGREGIVYRRIWGDLRSYSWKELKEIYTLKATALDVSGPFEIPHSMIIHIILPNGAVLKFDPDNYHLDEILSFDKLKAELKNSELSRIQKNRILTKSRDHTFYLVGKTFKYYLDSGKKEFTSNSP